MNGLDNRCIGFGLNKPDAEQTPDEVTELVATLIGPTTSPSKACLQVRRLKSLAKVHDQNK